MSDNAIAEMIAKGREVVRASLPNPKMPASMLDGYHAHMYLNDQARLVARTGKCEYGCRCELIELGAKKTLVCPATFTPCPTRAVQPLIALFGKINRHGYSDSTQ